MADYEFKKVLIADDKLENRRAAQIAISHASVVDSGSKAIEHLVNEPYDLLITDIQMETLWAGLDVVEAAYTRGIIPYTFSVHGAGHHGDVIKLLPEYHGLFGGSKSEPEVWRKAYDAIVQEEDATAKAYHNVMRLIRGSFGIPSFDRNIVFAIYSRQAESKPWVQMGSRVNGGGK